MATPIDQTARERLRAQVRREQELAKAVLNAEARLSSEIAKRDSVMAAQDQAVGARRAEVAEALANYVDGAGVGLERTAIIFGRPKSEVTRMVRDCRAIRRNP